MSSLSNWFSWGNSSSSSSELPEIFPVPIKQSEFIQTDVVNIYAKILTDVVERSHGLADDLVPLLWDNCVKSSSSDGLVTMLAKAMADKRDLFLVYEKALKVIRPATPLEAQQIKLDYEKQGESNTGVFVSFKNYDRSDMVRLYSGLEFCTVASLHKSMNLSKAVQLKMSDMRGSVSLADSSDVKTQGAEIAKALAKGLDVMLDAKDSIETSKPDLVAVEASMAFLDKKRSFWLGLPEAYINGIQTGGLGDTGDGDTRAIERGLKGYYFSIVRPVIEVLFGVKLTYKSQDFRQIAGSMEVIKTLSLVDESLVSLENKTNIVNKLLDLPEDAKGDAPKKVDPATAPQKSATAPDPAVIKV